MANAAAAQLDSKLLQKGFTVRLHPALVLYFMREIQHEGGRNAQLEAVVTKTVLTKAEAILAPLLD